MVSCIWSCSWTYLMRFSQRFSSCSNWRKWTSSIVFTCVCHYNKDRLVKCNPSRAGIFLLPTTRHLSSIAVKEFLDVVQCLIEIRGQWESDHSEQAEFCTTSWTEGWDRGVYYMSQFPVWNENGTQTAQDTRNLNSKRLLKSINTACYLEVLPSSSFWNGSPNLRRASWLHCYQSKILEG